MTRGRVTISVSHIVIGVAFLALALGVVAFLLRPVSILASAAPVRCAIEPKLGYHSKAQQEQGRKLATLLSLESAGGSGKLDIDETERAVTEIDETYAAIPDHHEACVLLYKTMLCATEQAQGGPLALKLADSVPRLCARYDGALSEAITDEPKVEAKEGSAAVLLHGNHNTTTVTVRADAYDASR